MVESFIEMPDLHRSNRNWIAEKGMDDVVMNTPV